MRYGWTMAKSGLVLVVLAVAMASVVGCSAPAPEVQPVRNVVLITVDTLRADFLGCYGGPAGLSPRIDRLAARGTRFEHALVQWPKTSPSVASLLTSTYGTTNGMMRVCGQRLPAHLDVLTMQLDRAGFDTAALVTNRFLGADYGFDRGFDEFTEVWETGRHDADRVTELAIPWLDRLEPPFFLWLHYLDPHTPYTPPPEFETDTPMRPVAGGDRKLVLTDGDEDMGVVPKHAQLPIPPRLSSYVARYEGEIRFLDFQVGRLLDALHERALEESTMVILTADHGESLGDHDYYFEHGRLPYDACLRVPLVIRVPWSEGNPVPVVAAPVALLNLAPTILEAVGLPVGDQAQGVSMWPLLAGRPQQLPDHVFAEAGYTQDHQRIVRRGPWKLILVPDSSDRSIMTGGRYELYDIQADPGETRNLAADRPQVVADLAARLEEWIADTPRAESPAETPRGMDDDTRAALRALGYAEEADAP